MDQLYYARQVVEGSPTQFVRFACKRNRDFWVKGDKVNRFVVRADAPILAKLAAKGATWEHIDGVSYARESDDELLQRSQAADKAWAEDPNNSERR